MDIIKQDRSIPVISVGGRLRKENSNYSPPFPFSKDNPPRNIS
jgi:hypothetical protein